MKIVNRRADRTLTQPMRALLRSLGYDPRQVHRVAVSDEWIRVTPCLIGRHGGGFDQYALGMREVHPYQ